MTNEEHFPAYRAGRGLGGVGIPFAVGPIMFVMMAANGAGPLLLMGYALIMVVVGTVGYALAKRGATITTPDHIELRTAFSTRRVAWRDIQAVETTGLKLSLQIAVIRDSSGRRLGLPHVNSNRIPSFSDEVRGLRELWERQRGSDWVPQQREQDDAAG